MTVNCDYCGEEIEEGIVPAVITRGFLFFKKTELMTYCSDDHRLMHLKELTG